MDYYRNRIKTILATLKKERYSNIIPLDEFKVQTCGYEMSKILENELSEWKSFHRGETWGGRDSHFCFQTEFVIPNEYNGKHVVIHVTTGSTDLWNTDNPQFLAYVDKKLVCGLDMNHTEIDLALNAVKGQAYDIRLYAYINSTGKEAFLNVSAAILHPLVQTLYYNIKAPFEVADLQREDDLKHIRTLEILNQTLNLLDLRKVGNEDFYTSIMSANEYLVEEYYNKLCGNAEVVEHCIGHTHIDVAWKWSLKQTREKVIRSFSTVLYLMDQYPEYKFMSSQPQLYQFVKEDCPELYEKIKEKVVEGRWETEGGMWLEADCNLTSGESLVRQILYGKQFFRQEFGKDNKVLWLPDVFGYSAALPQILKKSGIDYFMTTKIGWNEYNQIPNDTMLWQGIDGTEILTYFITTRNYNKYPDLTPKKEIATTYNGILNASQVMGCWQRYQNKNINQEILNCYGYGDGGGGATADMLEEGRRLAEAVPGCPQVKQTFVRDYFEQLEENLTNTKIPKWCGELYLEFHRGTYTSMARNKKYNRLCEFKNGDAELFSVMNMLNSEVGEYPEGELKHCWELTMLNQFHDILPGSSIKEVYEDSKEQYIEVLNTTNRLIYKGISGITSKIGTDTPRVVVMNTLGYEREGLIEVDRLEEDEEFGLYDGDTRLPYQKSSDNKALYWVKDIPSKGYIAFERKKEKINSYYNSIVVQDRIIDTPYYHILANEQGEFISIFDKKEERELIIEGARANVLQVFEDRPSEYDAWNIDAYYEEKMWEVNDLQEWKVLEGGEIRTCIYIKRKFMNSTIEQVIHFYNHSNRIDFKTTVDWKEEQLLLKVAFPLDIMTNKASYDIQFGNVERNTHRNTSWDQAKFEVCAHKWVDLSESGYGVALMNDCKYGYDVHDSVMRLTLIKSGIFPNPDADKEIHEFTYAILPHKGDFRTGKVIEEAYTLNCPLYAEKIDKQEGTLPKRFSILSADSENVIIETIKKAEDNNDVIVRAYEAYGQRSNTKMKVNIKGITSIWECDLLENKMEQYNVIDGDCSFVMKPYEIKTFRVTTTQ